MKEKWLLTGWRNNRNDRRQRRRGWCDFRVNTDPRPHDSASLVNCAYGARPLNRAIQQELLNPLSVMILSERVRDGEVVRVQFDGPHNRLHIVPNHEGTGESMDIDWDDVDDDIEIEEMD